MIQNGIPAKIIIICACPATPILQKLFNEILRTGNFLDKLVDVTPVFKKNNLFKKENYRPVSVSLVVLNIFETLLFLQKNFDLRTLAAIEKATADIV